MPDGTGSGPSGGGSFGGNTGPVWRVSQLYYRHGLRCASHPRQMLALSAILVAACAYPLWRLSTLGSGGHHFREGEGVSPPDWFHGLPIAYVQQIIVRSAVIPWDSQETQLLDAFRGPLYTSFKVSELVTNHQYEDISNNTRRKISLHDLCLQVQESSSGSSGLLPQYSCLVVSPALIWHRDPQRFLQDPHIVDSLFGQQDTKELFFGLPWRETGLKRSCLRNRQRVLSYAVTLLLERYDARYINSLREAMLKQFPLGQPSMTTTESGNDTTKGFNHTAQRSHLHFRYVHQLAEFLPLFVVYLLMAFYVYFSLSKVALLRSKILLAGATVATVFLSVIMTIGICLWLRLNPTLNGSPLVSPRAAPCAASEVLPYLLVIIGLENSLCITNSVVNCQPRGAKIHLARGLSREGWSLVKTLLTELSLLTMAFFTFVPVVQEFCLYSLIGVACDFVLQHFFFATLLSLDLQRKEKDDEGGALVGYPRPGHPGTIRHRNKANKAMARVFAGQPTQSSVLDKVPRRLRLLYIWTRFRVVQRSLMAILILWIVLLVQRSGVIESFRPLHAHNFTSSAHDSLATLNLISVKELKDRMTLNLPKELFEKTKRDDRGSSATNSAVGDVNKKKNGEEDILMLIQQKSSWKELPTSHWTTLFGFYNMSLWGRYVTVLPEIHVAIPIPHSEAVKFRHPEDASFQFYPDWSLLPEPNESLEVLARPLFILLTIPTTLFIVYLLATLYRCVCSRNYAQWRSQWRTRGLEGAMIPPDDVKPPGPLCHETFPIRLSGHRLPIGHIECSVMRNDIISASLDGELRVWDVATGECLKVIRRSPETNHSRMDHDDSKDEMWANIGGSVWAMACCGNFLVLSVVAHPNGAEGKGRLELWHTLEGQQHSYRECESPIVALAAQGRFIAAASMSGQLMAFSIETQNSDHQAPAKHRVPSCSGAYLTPCGSLKAHSQAVTSLCFPEEGTLLLTGSLDRLVKVFSVESDTATPAATAPSGGVGDDGYCDRSETHSESAAGLSCVYTLHGHAGPISALHADERQAVSACLQGMLCLWDLLTGTCIYSVEAHRAAISSVCLSALYVVSCSALEASFRVWERTQGHLLHTRHTACRQAELLSDDVLVTAGGELLLWDVHRAEQLQIVQLGVQMGGETGVRLLRKANANTLVCDSGSDLCVVYFPALTNKNE